MRILSVMSALLKYSDKIQEQVIGHHPYLACVSAFVRKPFERRSASSVSFCLISKYKEPI